MGAVEYVCLAGCALSLYFGTYRNGLVFDYRVKTADHGNGMDNYHSLPSYPVMVFQFWRCDWSDYFPERGRQT